MQQNYGPASAPLEEGRGPRSSLIALLLGGLGVDVLGSMVFVSALATAVAAVDATLGNPVSSTSFVALAAAGGSLLTVAGGYTAAWWARRRPIVHALGAGLLSLGFAMLGLWVQRDASRVWLAVGSLALHLPLAALGGYLFARSQPATA